MQINTPNPIDWQLREYRSQAEELLQKVSGLLLKIAALQTQPALADEQKQLLIINLVCGYYEVTAESLCSPSRDQHITLARHVAMFMLHRHTSLDIRAIAKQFNRHYTSCNHAFKHVLNIIGTDARERHKIVGLEERIKEILAGVQQSQQTNA